MTLKEARERLTGRRPLFSDRADMLALETTETFKRIMKTIVLKFDPETVQYKEATRDLDTRNLKQLKDQLKQISHWRDHRRIDA